MYRFALKQIRATRDCERAFSLRIIAEIEVMDDLTTVTCRQQPILLVTSYLACWRLCRGILGVGLCCLARPCSLIGLTALWRRSQSQVVNPRNETSALSPPSVPSGRSNIKSAVLASLRN